MAAPNGTVDVWNFISSNGTTVRKWLRDSWARRKIVTLQTQVATLQSQMTILRGDCAALDARVRALEDALAESNQT